MNQARDWYDLDMPDGGPIYTETHPGHFVVEPWNAFSSLLMLIPAIYWLYRIRGNWSTNKFLLYCISLVVIGGFGSALFHGLRISRFFLMMDILPSAVLSLSIAIYIWNMILKKWWYVLLIIVPTFFLRFLLFGRLPHHLAINLSYFIAGFIIALPLLIILFRTRFEKWLEVVSAIILFILALSFRELDSFRIDWLPMGTHFLWHTFAAAGTYYVLAYLYNLQDSRPISM